MTDLFEKPLAVAAIRFKWEKAGRTYDYFIPEGMELKPGDKVVVMTKRGEATVEVVEIKASSDRAEKQIVRVADEAPKADQTQTGEWDF